ncbi:CAP domain-containing protein [Robbsia sp. KACC 23696]|uniref:CAP domain-containing protein n=1 Tax=Robbsia sp. KACC 23696 TaxID=3149231 RepID=UPI00325BF702
MTFLPPVASAATGFTETADPAADSLTFVNYQRAQVGMPALSNNTAIATAAANHSLYLYDNTQVGHYETAGLTGYTGNSPEDRIDAVYSSNTTGEVVIAYQGITAFPSSSQPIQALFEAPFHRNVMLDDFLVSGVGYKQSGDTSKVSSLTMDYAGQQNALGSLQMIASPYNGQSNVETTWYASESPSPFEFNTSYNNTNVGYPVLLSAGLGASMTVSSFTIATAAGTNVPCQEIDESVEAESAGMAVCTPLAPLTANTSYIVSAKGTMTKMGGVAQAFDLQWEFTTGAVNVPYDAPSRLTASSQLNALAATGTTASTTGTPTPATASTGTPTMVMPSPQHQLSQ